MRASVPILLLTAALFSVLPFEAAAISASNRYRSPRNAERKARKSTELIVLHTTEAPARSSLNKLSERGEAHFCVTENGSVYAIVDRDKEAFHAGRSMWNGREDCDKYSIGIECVGYHNKMMPAIQLNAIRDLVKDLKKMYRLSDDRVVCHSHVAYGAPNKWQKRNHRGRKRCGMLFAMPSVRKYLELKSRPGGDSDVRARRLTVGDEYLEKVLYGRTDTMKSEVAKLKQPPAKSESGGFFSWFTRKKPEPEPPKPAQVAAKPAAPPKATPPKTAANRTAATQPAAKPAAATKTVTTAKPAAAAKTPAKAPVTTAKAPAKTATPAKATAMAAKTSAKPAAATKTVAKTTTTAKTASKPATASKTATKAKASSKTAKTPKSVADLKKSGYRIRGSIDRKHTAKQLVGERWNSPATYYTIRNRIIPGNRIDARKLEVGMQVWTR